MPDIFEHIKTALTQTARPIFVEIGAARGEDTEKIVRTIVDNHPGPGKFEYYAFEPDPRNIESIKRSDIRFCVNLLQAAVGDANCRAVFNQSGGTNPAFGYEHTLSGSLKKPVEHLQAHPWCKFEQQTDVRVVTLDDFYDLYSLSHIDFIWCDVQGAEDLVLKGAQSALLRTHYFYTEYYNNQMYSGQINAREIFDRLPGKWRVVEQWPNDILFENTCPQKSQ
jgi:FkbM family methyltransferase